jgi:hypothetical protein
LDVVRFDGGSFDKGNLLAQTSISFNFLMRWAISCKNCKPRKRSFLSRLGS